MWLDFERDQAHSLVFDVKDAGLYHVTTQGLLSTQCRIRTPVVQEVGGGPGGGAGATASCPPTCGPGATCSM